MHFVYCLSLNAAFVESNAGPRSRSPASAAAPMVIARAADVAVNSRPLRSIAYLRPRSLPEATALVPLRARHGASPARSDPGGFELLAALGGPDRRPRRTAQDGAAIAGIDRIR